MSIRYNEWFGESVMESWITQWNTTFFSFGLIIEGTTEKVLQFKMPLKSVYNQIFDFIE